MELTTKQRIILLSTLLGARGNLTELRILRELREALSFTEEEHAALEMVSDDEGNISWSSKNDSTKEVEIGEVARGLIIDQLKTLNRSGQLADGHLDIIELFPEAEV